MTGGSYCQVKLSTLSVSNKVVWTQRIRAPVIFFSSHYSEKMGFLQLVPSCDFLRADHITVKQKLSICTHTVNVSRHSPAIC